MKAPLLAVASAAVLLYGATTLAADPMPDNPKDAAGGCPNPPCAAAGAGAGGMGMMHRHAMGAMASDEDGKSRRCMHRGMMGGPMMGHMLTLPALPPGNAKLEMQMQAEIMQKVGEIIGKYAEQVKDLPPPKP